MEYIIILTFVFCALLALFEEHMGQYRWAIYISMGVVLILIAGLREIGVDPDSINYESTYLSADNMKDGTVEYSFILLSKFFNYLTSDVHGLFLFYALFGVGLKLYAFPKFGKLVFLPLMMYISYYFIAHECMQIRTGILSGIMLLAVIAIGEQQRKKALVLILLGSIFHMSALILVPVLFLSNKEMTRKQLIIWGSVIPAGYLLSFLGLTVFMNLPFQIPYISDKLTLYQEATEKGVIDFASVNIFSPLQLATIALFYYLLFFHDTIAKSDKFYPILIKTFALGIFSYAAFSFFPVLAERVNMLLKTVTIILYADIYQTIRPKWASISILFVLGLLYLNYSMPYIGVDLFWKV